MLQVQLIRDHKEAYAKALEKRGMDATKILNQVLKADETRRATQTKLDEILAELNSLSKEIGTLFKSGNAAEAGVLKEKTGTLKEASKTLDEQLKNVSQALESLLYTIPNIPNELVPSGMDEMTINKPLEKVTFLYWQKTQYHIGNWLKNMTSLILNWVLKSLAQGFLSLKEKAHGCNVH